MKNLFLLILLILLCVGCAGPAVAVKPTPCPEVPAAPTCEDKVIVIDEKGASCPPNTRATFPITGLFLPGKTTMLCQCK